MGKLCKILLVSAMLLVGGCSSKESEKKEPVSDNTEKTTLKITIQDEVNKKVKTVTGRSLLSFMKIFAGF